MQIPHSFEYNSQKSINELYGNIPLFISDDGYAAYRRGLQGILEEYALEWKTNLSALRLYSEHHYKHTQRMGAKGCTSSRTVVVGA